MTCEGMTEHDKAWLCMVGHGCACWSLDWHWLARCGIPVRGGVWRVVAGYGGASTFAAMPRHWLPRRDMRGDGTLKRLGNHAR
jgi:hypothetical protein